MASAGNANTSYSSLRRAQLTYEYLHTNSTTHEFLFGALAELVDNARDASSQKIDIYTEPCESCRGRFRLCFLDDGDGMDPSEVGNVVQFGRSVKRSVDSRMIGQYGNGLKSGTMRIGKDMILFTRKGNTMSCLFLSRTFHEREKIEEVVVPMPSWDASTKKSLAKSKREMDKHQVEVNLILKYSPFKTEDQLFEQFNKIGSKGSLVVVYNLKLMDNGEPELDIESDSHDIKMADPYEGGDVADYDMVMPERRSFRAYAAILYLDPRMKIYIQKKKVQTKRLTTCLYKPKSYHFTSKRFKTRSEKEAEKADREAKIAEERLRELETQSREIEAQAEQTSKDKRVELRKSQVLASEARSESKMKTQIAEAKKKSMKEPKTLGFTFGFNIENRRCYGIFIYNCSRLIRMYERAGPQLEGGVKCYGVIGVVDVPYLVLEPTHNKQDFADGKEFRHLTRALGEHLEQYWKDSQIESQGVTKFWENFGYISSKWTDDPSNEQKYARKRAMQIPLYVQCDSCLKWRLLPFSQRNVGRELPDEWCCAMNPDPNQNSCVRAEQKVNITVGQLQKQIKTAEEKSKEIMEDIKKKQEKLEQLGQRQRPSQVSTAQKFKEERVRSQPQAVKKVERTSSVDSSTSSRSDRSVSPLAKKPVVDSTEGAGRRKQSLEPLKRRNADSTPDLEQEVTQPKRKKDSVMTTKNVVKSENQRRKEREQKDQEQKERQRQQQERRKQEEQKERRKQEEQKERRKQEEEQQQQKQQQQQEEQQQETPVGATTETTDMEWSSEGENDGTALPKGTKVEARVDSDKWYIGTVFAVKPKKGSSCRVRVKFDMYPKDKYDKWFDHPSEDLRVLQPVESSPAPKSPSPTREVPSTTTAEPSVVKQLMSDISMPVQSPEDNRVSSMSDHTGDTVREPVLQDFVSMLRRCLCYFAPPKFRIKKEDIKEMSTEGLREFPLEQFFDDYEKGLTELVSRFQSERDDALKKLGETERRLEQRLEESDVNKRKLSNLRKIGAKLIRSLSEDPSESTISAEDDSDLVDLMLGDIANQAELRS